MEMNSYREHTTSPKIPSSGYKNATHSCTETELPVSMDPKYTGSKRFHTVSYNTHTHRYEYGKREDIERKRDTVYTLIGSTVCKGT